jgi:5-methylcytosine-specific restriction endonuclease McrA
MKKRPMTAESLEKLNAWKQANPERVKEATYNRLKEWRKNNPEKLKEQRQRVKTKQNGYQQKRRALLKNQLPDDADLNLIYEFYRIAELKTEETGIPYEVDHIIPISKGGLHHQNNLQVITRTENRSKGNKIL